MQNKCELCGIEFESKNNKKFCGLECKMKSKMFGKIATGINKKYSTDDVLKKVDAKTINMQSKLASLMMDYDIKSSNDIKTLDELLYNFFILNIGKSCNHKFLGKEFIIKRIR